MDYVFKTPSSVVSCNRIVFLFIKCIWDQAKIEIKLLKDIQSSVEGLYKDGRPLHHLPSARSTDFDPEASSVFVVEHRDFRSMDPQKIQDVFRHRHILVLGVPMDEDTVSFNEASLSLFGDIDRPLEITGMSFFPSLPLIN